MSENTVAAPVAPAAPAATPAAAPVAPAPAASGTPAQNVAPSAPATPPGETKPETPDAAEKRGQSRFERRIARLHREAAEARAERDVLRRQLDESKPKPVEDAGTPRLEAFKDIEEYANAKAKYASEQALKDHTTKQQNETNRQAQARMEESWTDKSERGAEKYDDWEEKVGVLKPSTPWAMAIMEAENGDDIAYHLASNLKEAQRIVNLPPLSQIREIGRLEAKLLADPPVKPQAPSKAPAPIAPLSGTTPAESFSVTDTRDIGKWIKNRSAQKHGARK